MNSTPNLICTEWISKRFLLFSIFAASVLQISKSQVQISDLNATCSIKKGLTRAYSSEKNRIGDCATEKVRKSYENCTKWITHVLATSMFWPGNMMARVAHMKFHSSVNRSSLKVMFTWANKVRKINCWCVCACICIVTIKDNVPEDLAAERRPSKNAQF